MTRTSRLTDIVLAVVGLILFAPLMAVIAGVVALSMPGPPVVRRRAPGSSSGSLYRFRVSAEDPGEGRVGAWLRSTNFDLLPSLINVARGEVSLRQLRRFLDA